MRQFRIFLEMRDLLDREDGATSSDIAIRLGHHPFAVKKSLPTVKRYSFGALSRVYRDLLLIEEQVKTGRGQPDELLDVFVARRTLTPQTV